MLVYQTNYQGIYVGPVEADESPLESGVYLIPAGCVTEAPPEIPPGKVARWDGSAWVLEAPPEPDQPTEPDPPEPYPYVPELSFAQLLIGLVDKGWITEAEGDAWADSVLPQAVTSLIQTLPADKQFAARVRAKRPSQVLRSDPLVQMLGAANGTSPEELDEFFRTYAEV